MTSRSLFFKLMKENAKRRLWIIAISILTFFFSFPVAMAMICGEYQNNNWDVELAYSRMVDSATSLITSSNGFVVALMIMASVLCAVSSFSYLHSKKKVDFFHSLPVRREIYFWVNYVNGILIVAVPYLICELLSIAVMGMNGIFVGAVFQKAITTFLFHMLYFILLYAVATVAMMMTGNIVIGIMGNMVFCGYIPIVSMLFGSSCEMFFDTYYGGNLSDMFTLLYRISPFSEYIYQYSKLYSEEVSAGAIAAAIFASAAITLLALKLYQLRPSEAAGKAMAFRKTQTVIKILLVIPSAIAGMMFFYVMRDSDAWGIFGLICGLLLSYCLIEIIYNFDFRKMFSHKKHLIFCAVVSICYVCIFRFDLVGYDTYLPKEDNVESGSIYIGSLDGWVDYSTPELYEYTVGVPSLKYKYENNMDHAFANMKLSDAESILKVASEGINQLDVYDRNEYYMEPAEDEEDSFYTRIYIQYHLKNGRKPIRSYYINASKVMDTLDQIYKSEEYKKGIFPVLTQTADEIAGVNYQECSEVMHVNLKSGDSGKQELLEAYQEELMGLSLKTRKNESPVCMIQFKTNEMQAMIEVLKKADQGEWTRFNDYAVYPVYPSFTKTISLLKQNGIDVGNQYMPASQIAKIVLRNGYSFYDLEDLPEDNADVVVITDKQQIRELKSALVWNDYVNINNLRDINYNISVDIYMNENLVKTDDDRSYDQGFHLPSDQIEEFFNE